MLRILWILLFTILLNIYTYCQIKNIGLPFIKNYSKVQYKAGSQNWDMVQDNRDIMYFANNNGILEFDGDNWKVYRTENQSIVRSVAIGNDKTLYAGAYNELGYLKKNPSGNFTFQSLVNLIPKEYRNFDEIWKIYQTQYGILFQSFKYIFIFKNGKFEVIKPFSRFGFSFYIHNTYFVIDKEQGILKYEDGRLVPIINKPEIFNDNEIRFILPYMENKYLVGILNQGLFVLEGNMLTPWEGIINKHILKNHIFSGIFTSSNYYVFGTIRDGFYITDITGNILQHINRTRGLQNNTILSLYTDKLGNIWTGLDNGISYTEISSPATIINHCFGIETGYTSLIQNNILYFGTNQGLFAKKIDQLPNNPDVDSNFTLIEGTQGQVWTLFSATNEVLCGHNNGTFLVDGFNATKISSIRGVWKFIQPEKKPDELIAGTYTGLFVLKKDQKNEWTFSHIIKGFSESCKDLVEGDDGEIFISHGYKGVYLVKLNHKRDSVIDIKLYAPSNSLPGKLPFEIHKINGQIFITNNIGCFEFRKSDEKFVISAKFNNLFKNNPSIYKLFKDSDKNIWYSGQNKMGVYRLLEDGNYREVTMPFYKFSSNLVPAFENIYPFNKNNVFIGVQDGFIHYDPTIIKKYNESFPVYIREIKFLKKYTDSILSFEGYTQKNNSSDIDEITYSANSLSFRFAAPFFEDPDKTEYRCRLKGYSNEWSPWDNRTIREYTNLHEGEYTFEVEAQNIYKTTSFIDSYTFKVSPPLHRSVFAYILYVVLAIVTIVVNIFYFKKRIERTRLRDKILHEQNMQAKEQQFREESLVSEKEIERLKNEKLLSEMKHKDKELANSTMYIIQKNKFLNALKDELSEMIKSVSENSKTRIRQLLKKIDRDLNNEKYFKVFDTYFDDVHQDFLNRLKDKHKELTPKELRLCAYIRMNISSKEIASLLNISIRGVEVSRYRLRKKLGLERETNLTEYILNL